MADQDPRNQPPVPRRSLAQKLVTGWTVLWSWLTDPAVLIYRRAAHGRKRARVQADGDDLQIGRREAALLDQHLGQLE